MRPERIICLAVSLICEASIVAAGVAGSLAEHVRNAREFAEYYLECVSDFEGVEHFGGPFKIEDYTVTERLDGRGFVDLKFRPNFESSLTIHYPRFQVIGTPAAHHGITNRFPVPPVYGAFSVEGELGTNEINSLLEAAARHQISPEEVDLLTFVSARESSNEKRILTPINRVKAISSEKAVVYGGQNLNYEFGYLPHRNRRELIATPPNFPLRFIIKEAIPADKIRDAIVPRDGTPEARDWSEIQPGSPLEIVQAKYDHAPPGDAQFFQKSSNGWEFVYHFWISPNSAPDFRLPRRCDLLPKPARADVNQVLRAGFEYRNRTKLLPEDLDAVIELLLRIPRISHEVVSIEERDGQISIRTSDMPVRPLAAQGDAVILVKNKGVWMIVLIGPWYS
jgi:hypothetical protein